MTLTQREVIWGDRQTRALESLAESARRIATVLESIDDKLEDGEPEDRDEEVAPYLPTPDYE